MHCWGLRNESRNWEQPQGCCDGRISPLSTPWQHIPFPRWHQYGNTEPVAGVWPETQLCFLYVLPMSHLSLWFQAGQLSPVRWQVWGSTVVQRPDPRAKRWCPRHCDNTPLLKLHLEEASECKKQQQGKKKNWTKSQPSCKTQGWRNKSTRKHLYWAPLISTQMKWIPMLPSKPQALKWIPNPIPTLI